MHNIYIITMPLWHWQHLSSFATSLSIILIIIYYVQFLTKSKFSHNYSLQAKFIVINTIIIAAIILNGHLHTFTQMFMVEHN